MPPKDTGSPAAQKSVDKENIGASPIAENPRVRPRSLSLARPAGDISPALSPGTKRARRSLSSRRVSWAQTADVRLYLKDSEWTSPSPTPASPAPGARVEPDAATPPKAEAPADGYGSPAAASVASRPSTPGSVGKHVDIGSTRILSATSPDSHMPLEESLRLTPKKKMGQLRPAGMDLSDETSQILDPDDEEISFRRDGVGEVDRAPEAEDAASAATVKLPATGAAAAPFVPYDDDSNANANANATAAAAAAAESGTGAAPAEGAEEPTPSLTKRRSAAAKLRASIASNARRRSRARREEVATVLDEDEPTMTTDLNKIMASYMSGDAFKNDSSKKAPWRSSTSGPGAETPVSGRAAGSAGSAAEGTVCINMGASAGSSAQGAAALENGGAEPDAQHDSFEGAETRRYDLEMEETVSIGKIVHSAKKRAIAEDQTVRIGAGVPSANDPTVRIGAGVPSANDPTVRITACPNDATVRIGPASEDPTVRIAAGVPSASDPTVRISPSAAADVTDGPAEDTIRVDAGMEMTESLGGIIAGSAVAAAMAGEGADADGDGDGDEPEGTVRIDSGMEMTESHGGIVQGMFEPKAASASASASAEEEEQPEETVRMDDGMEMTGVYGGIVTRNGQRRASMNAAASRRRSAGGSAGSRRRSVAAPPTRRTTLASLGHAGAAGGLNMLVPEAEDNGGGADAPEGTVRFESGMEMTGVYGGIIAADDDADAPEATQRFEEEGMEETRHVGGGILSAVTAHEESEVKGLDDTDGSIELSMGALGKTLGAYRESIAFHPSAAATPSASTPGHARGSGKKTPLQQVRETTAELLRSAQKSAREASPEGGAGFPGDDSVGYGDAADGGDDASDASGCEIDDSADFGINPSRMSFGGTLSRFLGGTPGKGGAQQTWSAPAEPEASPAPGAVDDGAAAAAGPPNPLASLSVPAGAAPMPFDTFASAVGVRFLDDASTTRRQTMLPLPIRGAGAAGSAASPDTSDPAVLEDLIDGAMSRTVSRSVLEWGINQLTEITTMLRGEVAGAVARVSDPSSAPAAMLLARADAGRAAGSAAAAAASGDPHAMVAAACRKLKYLCRLGARREWYAWRGGLEKRLGESLSEATTSVDADAAIVKAFAASQNGADGADGADADDGDERVHEVIRACEAAERYIETEQERIRRAEAARRAEDEQKRVAASLETRAAELAQTCEAHRSSVAEARSRKAELTKKRAALADKLEELGASQASCSGADGDDPAAVEAEISADLATAVSGCEVVSSTASGEITVRFAEAFEVTVSPRGAVGYAFTPVTATAAAAGSAVAASIAASILVPAGVVAPSAMRAALDSLVLKCGRAADLLAELNAAKDRFGASVAPSTDGTGAVTVSMMVTSMENETRAEVDFSVAVARYPFAAVTPKVTSAFSAPGATAVTVPRVIGGYDIVTRACKAVLSAF